MVGCGREFWRGVDVQGDEVTRVIGAVLLLQTRQHLMDVPRLAQFLLAELQELLLRLCDILVAVGEHLLDDFFQRGIVKGCVCVGVVVLQRLQREDGLNVGEGLPADKGLKGTEGDGDFGLVVGVGELFWVLLVELGGELFVWVDLRGVLVLVMRDIRGVRTYLKGESFGNGENLDGEQCQWEESWSRGDGGGGGGGGGRDVLWEDRVAWCGQTS